MGFKRGKHAEQSVWAIYPLPNRSSTAYDVIWHGEELLAGNIDSRYVHQKCGAQVSHSVRATPFESSRNGVSPWYNWDETWFPPLSKPVDILNHDPSNLCFLHPSKGRMVCRNVGYPRHKNYIYFAKVSQLCIVFQKVPQNEKPHVFFSFTYCTALFLVKKKLSEK